MIFIELRLTMGYYDEYVIERVINRPSKSINLNYKLKVPLVSSRLTSSCLEP